MRLISSGLVILLLLTNLIGVAQTTQEPSVTLTLTITDKSGRYVGGLRKEQITALDQERPQEIVKFSKMDSPVSVGFLFDASMLNSEVWKVSQDALLKFMADSNPANEYFLAAFDSKTHPATSFTNDRKQMSKAFDDLRKMRPSNNRNLYDAIQASLKTVQAGQYAKRAIIVIGGDNDMASSMKYEALLEQLKRLDVLLYMIGWKSGDASATVFKELTSVSGGAAFRSTNPTAFADSFEIISLELRHQYTLEYKGESSSPDTWHSLKFQVKPLQLKDSEVVPLLPRGRAGYYSR
jgi:VWFA-related protein